MESALIFGGIGLLVCIVIVIVVVVLVSSNRKSCAVPPKERKPVFLLTEWDNNLKYTQNIANQKDECLGAKQCFEFTDDPEVPWCYKAM